MRKFKKSISVLLTVLMVMSLMTGVMYSASAEENISVETTSEHRHEYVLVDTVEPKCTEVGYSTYECSCGSKYDGSRVKALGHNFVDGVCSRCYKDQSEGCTHMCHKNSFIWKILLFFFELFKSNRVCSCGVNHY